MDLRRLALAAAASALRKETSQLPAHGESANPTQVTHA